MRWYATAMLLVLALSGNLCAQEPSRGPDGRTSTHVSGIEVLNIPNKPFTAKSTIEWDRTLADGSVMHLRLEALVARDSRGRVYRERHNFVPANSTGPAPLYEIHLYDPITKTQMLCSGRSYRCGITNYRPLTFFEATPEGVYDNGTLSLKRESLGSDTIEGISVTGTRETTTTAPGAKGNEQAMISTNEFWYSDELQTNLAVTRINPLDGKQVLKLTNIARGEPDTHLWDVPEGFKVLDMRTPKAQQQ